MALMEIEKEKETKTLVFSKVSFTAVQAYLEALRIAVFEGELNIQVASGIDFQRFVWRGSEEDCTGDAVARNSESSVSNLVEEVTNCMMYTLIINR